MAEIGRRRGIRRRPALSTLCFQNSQNHLRGKQGECKGEVVYRKKNQSRRRMKTVGQCSAKKVCRARRILPLRENNNGKNRRCATFAYPNSAHELSALWRGRVGGEDLLKGEARGKIQDDLEFDGSDGVRRS